MPNSERTPPWIDVSTTLSPDLPTYPGDPPVEIVPCAAVRPDDLDSFAMSRLSLSSHAGTHIDPPCHFIPGGASVSQIPLSQLCGDCVVVDVRGHGPVIDRATLEAALGGPAPRVLLRTDNAGLLARPYTDRYVSLGLGAAELLVHEANSVLVGIDYVSIEAADSPGFPVHRALLAAGVVIVEGLELGHVAGGQYELACLPLKVAGGDGGPARVAVRRWSRDLAR